MEQMIEIYEDLNKKFCRKEAQSIYQMILDTLKNLESENRIEVLKQLVENNDALGFLNKFNKWGPKWMQHNWQTWQSDVERELNNVIGDAFCDLEDAYQCAYETTLEDLCGQREDRAANDRRKHGDDGDLVERWCDILPAQNGVDGRELECDHVCFLTLSSCALSFSRAYVRRGLVRGGWAAASSPGTPVLPIRGATPKTRARGASR